MEKYNCRVFFFKLIYVNKSPLEFYKGFIVVLLLNIKECNEVFTVGYIE